MEHTKVLITKAEDEVGIRALSRRSLDGGVERHVNRLKINEKDYFSLYLNMELKKSRISDNIMKLCSMMQSLNSSPGEGKGDVISV